MKKSDWDRISEDYYGEIISPIKNAIGKNLLLEAIKRISSKRKVVADLGCGTGPLLRSLSKKYKSVYALDFSDGMIEQAKKNSKSCDNISYFVQDLLSLRNLRGKLNVAISVNSILEGESKKVDKVFSQIYNSLKKGGVFLGVLPAMESYIYQAMLIINGEVRKGKSQAQARFKAKRMIKPDEHDFLQGTIKFDGDTEKTFYEFEIFYRLKKAGFRDIKVSKVYYDWKEWKDAGQAYFPRELPPWDWFVECKK